MRSKHSDLRSTGTVPDPALQVQVPSTSSRSEPKSTAAEAVEFAPVADWERQFWQIAQRPEWEQSEFLEDVAANIPDAQIRDVLDRLSPDRSNAAQVLMELLVERWAGHSPEDAAAWVSRLPDDELAQRLFSKVAKLWADKDLAGAMGWVQQLQDSGNKVAAELSLGFEAASQQQPVVAIALIANVPPGPERDGVLDYAVQQWAVADTDSAVAWASKLPDTTLRDKILTEVASDLGARDPERATDFITTKLPAGELQDKATITVIRFWASSDVAGAAAWVLEFPDGPLQVMATANLVDVWAKNDFATAVNWVNQLPSGPLRETASCVLATTRDELTRTQTEEKSP